MKDFTPGRHPEFISGSNKQGFTLIELLVVVLIIGILAAVALPQYQKAVYKSRMAEGFLVMRNLVQAEQAYFMASGTYTGNFEDLDITYVPSEHFEVTWISLSGNQYAGLNVTFPFTAAALEYTLHSVRAGNIGKYYCRTPPPATRAPGWGFSATKTLLPPII